MAAPVQVKPSTIGGPALLFVSLGDLAVSPKLRVLQFSHQQKHPPLPAAPSKPPPDKYIRGTNRGITELITGNELQKSNCHIFLLFLRGHNFLNESTDIY